MRIPLMQTASLWLKSAGFRQLFVSAPRPELEQALLRVAIPAFAALWLSCDLVLSGRLEHGEWLGLWIAVGFLAFAGALALHILFVGDRNPKLTIARRFIGIFADNAVNTYFMLVMGEGGAVVLGVYLFVTFGNGFRFGRTYLHISQALSLIGFSFVLFYSSFWSLHLAVGLGVLVAMIVLPFYVGVLAERITVARLRADEANAAKGRFLANVSHEMRTPLNGVIAMSDLLRETHLAESQREIVETLSTSAELALAQIEEILGAAKIEAGRVQLESRPFDLGKLLTTAVKVIIPQARYKGLGVNVDVAPDAAGWFSGDVHHLRQILLNLLANAVKFTERGEISLRARRIGALNEVAMLRIEVHDTGIGIPQSKQTAIFEAFAQADDSVTRVYGGTGLGTTIARQLVTLMGGKLGLASVEGVGSTFWFELSLPVAEPQGIDLVEELASTRKVQGPAYALAAGQSATVHKIRGARVLVAEDNPTNQRVAQMILESGGHVATIVKNGEEALDALERGNFDVALFDLSMPVVSGLDALKLYRFAAARPIPVIILSANVTTAAVAECQLAGAAEFIAKPVRASLLLDAIERNLSDTVRVPAEHPPVRREDGPSLTVVDIPPIDPLVILELANFSSDPTFVERLIRGFRSDCDRLITQLEDGLAKRKYEAVKDAAHALRGGAGSVGATQLMQFATRVDKATHDTIRLKASLWAEELGQIEERTFAALDAHLETHRQRQSSSS
ncbi:MAG: response regulator [Betaproteobacteria bacterium]|nr:response regulator [Betaproteobacteria bacterium]